MIISIMGKFSVMVILVVLKLFDNGMWKLLMFFIMMVFVSDLVCVNVLRIGGSVMVMFLCVVVKCGDIGVLSN